MAVSRLKPGFRFHPSGVELVVYFLKRKVMGKKFFGGAIAELDIYRYAPWDLPAKSCLRTGELEWYFFCPLEKKYGSGSRIKRATEIGYWKATGRDRPVQYNNKTVGMIRTLIFHKGKSPKGERTNWVMHEHRLEDKDLADKGIAQNSYVVCKVFEKEGLGPRNGAQYARPFNEEEWSDEELEIPCTASTAPVPILPMTSDASVPKDNSVPASGCTSCLSRSMPLPGTADPSDPNDQVVNNDDEDILRMNDISEDGDRLFEKPDNDQENIAGGVPPLAELFVGLDAYLDAYLAGISSGQNAEFSTNGMVTTDDVWSLDFIELSDLDISLV
ncbi:NAC domain-containing protein 82-like [Vigna umbellata]|uniref:NAC domain-containing protein 82-like n=1 Tax=Vigna umbellata TaxID=87088 RepID=UPI001F5E6AA8|nr:NAC domain-containing protein 82-like [Vigna umbellata]